ncbi:MAG: hypothetical protein RI909_1134 [Bacteroidota bacterium]
MVLLQYADYFEFLKYFFGVGCIFQFIGEILPGPMFIMLSFQPQSGGSDIIHISAISYPHLIFVLPIAQSKLRFGDFRQLLHYREVR